MLLSGYTDTVVKIYIAATYVQETSVSNPRFCDQSSRVQDLTQWKTHHGHGRGIHYFLRGSRVFPLPWSEAKTGVCCLTYRPCHLTTVENYEV
ncbi:hypothetical protein AVEN_202632-1 [Araneus ventricosus]|uniref:Uncharacterized protein n=1 Tax=Araneus ventricosus TaxID=182803 RepID=A0A4Y2IYL6_ARAVE|nr:hypothetical protein AVEN_202632-1 [Araneus ventricosus]